MLSGKDTGMPKSPSGRKRPTDVVSNAVHVMRVATGELPNDAAIEDGKNPAAVALGKMGGQARADALSKKRRTEIAKRAARTRWNK